MLGRLQRFFRQREALKNLIVKNLRAKYRSSFSGISWAIVTPLLLTLVISFIFTKVIKVEVEGFPLFVLAAILPWIFFTTSLSEATNSIVSNAELINQFTILKETIPISSVLANFINFLFGLTVMIPIFAIFRPQIVSLLILLPIILLFHLIFTVGLALFLSTLNVYFRDVNHLLGLILMFWFWVTPIFYSVDMVPPQFRWICKLNPMTSYITVYRNILFEAKVPELETVSIVPIAALIMLIIGYITFLKCEGSFIKKI